MNRKYNLFTITSLSILLFSCSTGSSSGSSDIPSGTYGNIEFTPSGLNLAVGTSESVTIALVNSSLSPDLTIPLSTSTNGIVIIPNKCQLGGVPPGPMRICTFTVQAVGVGTTNIVAGWPGWPAISELSVVVN
jgi:hypothetical protein